MWNHIAKSGPIEERELSNHLPFLLEECGKTKVVQVVEWQP